MTNEERGLFWETLCSLPGEDTAKEMSCLNDTLVLPPAIYRYRKVDDNTVDALENNRLFFSTADHYDDPFDTYINIDYEAIRAHIEKGIADREGLILRFKERWSALGRPLPSEEILDDFTKEICENSEKYIRILFQFLKQNVQTAFQQRIWSSCFCESPLNQSMWIKYGAESHGFCLMYSLKASEIQRLKCGTDPRCDICAVKKYGLELFPVFYSKKKYDATSTAFEIVAEYLQLLINGVSIPLSDFVQRWVFSKWSLEKVALIKSIDHEHDMEWRLLFTGQTTNRIQCEWLPSAVIFGLRMSDEDKAKVKSSAKKAGIPKAYSVAINMKNELELIEDVNY